MSEENITDLEDNLAFQRYMLETQKFPIEMEALKSTIESNKSTVELAESTNQHFEASRKSNNNALYVSVGVGILTLIVLLVQTYSTQKTQLESPIELNDNQLKQVINFESLKNHLMFEQIDSLESKILLKIENENIKLKELLRKERQNNQILNRKLDSVLSEFNNLAKIINKSNINIKNEKSNKSSNR